MASTGACSIMRYQSEGRELVLCTQRSDIRDKGREGHAEIPALDLSGPESKSVCHQVLLTVGLDMCECQ
jgi:hypothetical protein